MFSQGFDYSTSLIDLWKDRDLSDPKMMSRVTPPEIFAWELKVGFGCEIMDMLGIDTIVIADSNHSPIGYATKDDVYRKLEDGIITHETLLGDSLVYKTNFVKLDMKAKLGESADIIETAGAYLILLTHSQELNWCDEISGIVIPRIRREYAIGMMKRSDFDHQIEIFKNQFSDKTNEVKIKYISKEEIQSSSQ